MKRLFSFMALLMVSVMVVPHADAKKFGGGKSFGKSFKTAPAQKQQNTNTLKQQDTAKTTAATSNKKGLMGGMLGGLLAGGLLAAFFGGAFEGIQFMDILIIGLIAFVIFKLMRGLLGAKQTSINQHQQPAYSSVNQPNVHNFEQTNPTGGFGGQRHSDVPHNYPPGFDKVAFINGAREHYRILQGAWNHNQLETIEEYVSASLFEDLKAERAKLDHEPQTDVMYVDAEIVRADYDVNKAQLSLQFSGRYRDAGEQIEEDIQDIWHLERDLSVPNAPWLIVGIQG
ncbi:TIM44-like domain-containing protein [Vibrio sp. V27_P1S3P104]|uniref:Tim44 domain-containing protein n=1 Tax=Vibrio TaxID=662 RepID=UPI000C16F08F|nr:MULTISPECIES: Tim44 domain-containing protein [Vibrio]NAW69203.1 TIM44-like domain-containing protein [Vibrio sp. V28_P6S34P95]NAX05402.1 TIM44-like domain-containing protein [Vibrio sp. V30_P3S12P165]NAX34913.1 TIM44-like domain-containing protein [Vibrio sp. V29_P1S30P107]NAX37160.1 TIM44-like domain-containing protein [Vibrio sp. V27_P1S3P104]NAX39456.1 TIM44-like domain-containing protein [Vibrio sp. V26_P1S5P106]